MRILHGILTTVAALFVIAYGGMYLWNWYQYRDTQKDWQTETAEEQAEQEPPGIPLTGKGELRAFPAAYGETVLSFGGKADAVLVPIFFEKGGAYGQPLLLSAEQAGKKLDFFGDCETSPMVNVIYVDLGSGKTVPLLDHRAFLPGVGAAMLKDDNAVILFVVDQDTNGDGYLNCDDTAKLEVRKLISGERFLPQIKFMPGETSFRRVNDDDIMMVLDEQNETSDVRSHIYRLNLTNGEVSEIVAPDFLPEAYAAIEKQANE